MRARLHPGTYRENHPLILRTIPTCTHGVVHLASKSGHHQVQRSLRLSWATLHAEEPNQLLLWAHDKMHKNHNLLCRCSCNWYFDRCYMFGMTPGVADSLLHWLLFQSQLSHAIWNASGLHQRSAFLPQPIFQVCKWSSSYRTFSFKQYCQPTP